MERGRGRGSNEDGTGERGRHRVKGDDGRKWRRVHSAIGEGGGRDVPCAMGDRTGRKGKGEGRMGISVQSTGEREEEGTVQRSGKREGETKEQKQPQDAKEQPKTAFFITVGDQ